MMMTQTEALRLALEALELAHPRFGIATEKHKQAITAIKAALEAKDEPEYYGLTKDHLWMSISKEHYDRLKPEFRMTCYTTPPQQEAKDEPVGDNKVKQLVNQCTHRDIDGNWYVDGVQLVHATCDAIIKGTI